jgi:hypothetical protein
MKYLRGHRGRNTMAGQERPVAIVGEGYARDNYQNFFSSALDNALRRKSSFEQRGITVVTTSGALVTLVFTVVSFVLAHVGRGAVNPHSIIRGYLDVAAILFVIAAFLGLVVNLPIPYGEPNPYDLGRLLFPKEEEVMNALSERASDLTEDQVAKARSASRFLTDSGDTAAWEISLTFVNLLARARKLNQVRAIILFLAILSEVGAIGFLAWGSHRLLGIG